LTITGDDDEHCRIQNCGPWPNKIHPRQAAMGCARLPSMTSLQIFPLGKQLQCVHNLKTVRQAGPTYPVCSVDLVNWKPSTWQISYPVSWCSQCSHTNLPAEESMYLRQPAWSKLACIVFPKDLGPDLIFLWICVFYFNYLKSVLAPDIPQLSCPLAGCVTTQCLVGPSVGAEGDRRWVHEEAGRVYKRLWFRIWTRIYICSSLRPPTGGQWLRGWFWLLALSDRFQDESKK
jgi:hypothetical protein